MGKFNVVHKEKRAQSAAWKRAIHGDPNTRKLKQKPQPLAISGKRKRKLFKKWRREQKEALQKGLVTMQDVEMAIADGPSEDTSNKAPMKFPMKKGKRMKIKKLKGKGKSRKKATKATEDTIGVENADVTSDAAAAPHAANADAMVE